LRARAPRCAAPGRRRARGRRLGVGVLCRPPG
jgi:hypothetical protein